MSKLTAVMVVRNEADLLGVNLLHHVAQGISEFRIVDNGSSDRTPELLRELAHEFNVVWTRNAGPFHQADMMTALAREAFLAGADWIVPIDADEFWSADGEPLARILGRSTAGVIASDVVNFIQDRDSGASGPTALLTMTHRVAAPRGRHDQSRELVESQRIAFVEIEYPRKCLFRASAALAIGAGAHEATGTRGPAVTSAAVACLHAPIRSRQSLDARAEHGRRLIDAGYPPLHGWQNQRWHQLQTGEWLDEEWRANSVHDGFLGDRRTPVVFDARLSDAIRPILSRVTQAAAR